MAQLRDIHLEQFFSVLARPLTEDIVPVSSPAEVRVGLAAPKEAELWIHTVAQGFGNDEIPAQETLDILAPNFYSTNGTCFFAWIDGQPTGGGAIYTHRGGVADFHRRWAIGD